MGACRDAHLLQQRLPVTTQHRDEVERAFLPYSVRIQRGSKGADILEKADLAPLDAREEPSLEAVHAVVQ